MVIQCPECTTRFKLADDKIKPEGVKVRCAKCRHIFTVMPEAVAETLLPPIQPKEEEPATAGAFTEEKEETAASTDDLWGSEFAESDLDAPLSDQEPAATTEAPSTTNWSASFEESDLGLSSIDDRSAEPTPPDTDFQLDESWGEEPAPDTTLAAFEENPEEIGSGPDKSSEEANPDVAFDFEEETIGAGSVDEFEFGDELTTGESLKADEFSFEEETSTETDNDLPGLAFEESATDEFSFESDSADASDAFSFDEDDLFAPDTVAPAEEDHTDDIRFDEPLGAESDANNLDFDDISFGEPSDKNTTALESPDSIVSVERPKPVEVPVPDPPQPLDPDVNLPPLQTQKRKYPMSNVLRIFLILLLVLASIAGYLLWQGGTSGISQLVNQLMGKQEQNVPAAQIRLPLPNSFFIMNQEAGQLFVVQGEAVNGYAENRSAIAVKGMLHDNQGNMLMQQTVFCGNLLDHEELQTATVAQLEEAMNNQFGNVLSNLNVDPGKSIPYMIIFRNLPENVTEFTVEVADSKPGGQR